MPLKLRSVPCLTWSVMEHRLAHGFRNLSMSDESREGTGLV
jgi:hypothetical protein